MICNSRVTGVTSCKRCSHVRVRACPLCPNARTRQVTCVFVLIVGASALHCICIRASGARTLTNLRAGRVDTLLVPMTTVNTQINMRWWQAARAPGALRMRVHYRDAFKNSSSFRAAVVQVRGQREVGRIGIRIRIGFMVSFTKWQCACRDH